MVYKKEEDEALRREEQVYNITFEKRRTKSNIRFGAKLLFYLMLAAVSGAFFSSIMINHKYGSIIKKIEDFNNNEMVISDYTKIVDKVAPSIVTISDVDESLLSNDENSKNVTGIILDEEGNILTNYDPIKSFGNTKVKLSTDNSEIYEAKVIVKSEDLDLCILKIECEEKLKPVKFAKSDSLRIGQSIAVLGNTTGVNSVDNISPGIITSKSEEVNGGGVVQELLQLSATINKTNTGGPICNSNGEVIGLASSYLSEINDEGSFYYGVKLKDLEAVINSTNAFKAILGVTEGGILSGNENEFKGFYVQELDENGNAYRAGIKPTDIILEIDDNKIISVDEAAVTIQKKKAGDIIKCKVLQDGEVKHIDVKIEK